MNNWLKYLIGSLIVIGIVGLGFVSKVITYYPKIVDCKKQLRVIGSPYGIIESPVELIGLKEITTIGCAYDFHRDAKRSDLITFNFIVVDKIGLPYIYEMKIDKFLSICRRNMEQIECGRESVADYRDFPEGKIVNVGIINDLIPNEQTVDQPDLEYISKLERALTRGKLYPLQLSKRRIQVWSLVY